METTVSIEQLRNLISNLYAEAAQNAKLAAIGTLPIIEPLSTEPFLPVRQLLAEESGSVCTANVSTYQVAYKLPLAQPGLAYTFVRGSSGVLEIFPTSGDTIIAGDLELTEEGTWLQGNFWGCAITLFALSANRWIALSSFSLDGWVIGTPGPPI